MLERRRARSELLLDTERIALQALFDMIRRFKVGYTLELHKRTLSGAAVADRPRRRPHRRAPRIGADPARSTPTRA